MADTFYANSNVIKINNGSNVVFDTSYRMPHILSSISGSFNSASATITSGASGTFVNTTTDNIVSNASYYQFSNSFVWAYIDITTNSDRTDVYTGNPIFVTGSMLLRFYVGHSSLRGSYILTPMVFSGGIGFREEWQYADNQQTTVPGGLFPVDVSNTTGNLGLTYQYTLYYGRFI
jgi:hypothetical protein